ECMRASALPDMLGLSNDAVTKDRLYRTLDALLQAQQAIEDDLKEQLGTLFQLDYDLLLYDLTSTYFEGLAEDNDLARRGYSRDHRRDCKQVVIALVVTRDGFPCPTAPWRATPRMAPPSSGSSWPSRNAPANRSASG